MSIKIIGITGPSGAGKSELSRILKKRLVPCIDADKVYHSLLTPESDCTAALVCEFGEEILDENGAPDRKKLGNIVFSSPQKLEKLNSIVLHFVIENIKASISALDDAGEKNVAVDAPTLIESGFHLECDTVVSVLADTEKRIERIRERDKISKEAAEKRIFSQHPDEFYISHSDIVISNNASSEEFLKEAEEVLSEILR